MNETEPMIRLATKSDRQAIAQLQLESWQTTYHHHLPNSYLTGQAAIDLADHWQSMRLGADEFVLVAFREDCEGLAGFIAVTCRPDPFIDNLHCQPSMRSRGTGRALMSAAFERLRDMGKTSVSLTVLVGNDRAKAFYLRLGATVGPVRREAIGGYPVDTERLYWTRF
ncbi:GNAT family N-acetyltransferase [uncultured Cohaesibacter sp.]|uniref:GNAT family N-acetyltransferase n=1 Tax=uncultured Cohaesibacter sp. TaxID=1002546 RepID=UPI0029C6F9F5|nr:GNAT family N-acetyltransferase [uncultured Cohaesibacter sp.]